MPMVVSHKQRIYFRYEGDKGAFLLLHHGLLGRHQDWFEAGYVEELAQQFRLIIPDARGHGRSDHPAQPEDYSPDELADDMIAILDALDIRNTHFLGVSLGALVGFNLLQRYPERLRVTLLGGEVPFVSQAAREAWAGYAEQLSTASLQALRMELRGPAAQPDPDTPEEQEAGAAGALLQAMCNWAPFPDERVSVRSPLALFCGDRDPAMARIQSAVARIARVRVIPLPGPTTRDVFLAREPLLELLHRYIRSGRKGGEPRNGAHEADNRPRGPRQQRGEQGSESPGPHTRADEPPSAAGDNSEQNAGGQPGEDSTAPADQAGPAPDASPTTDTGADATTDAPSGSEEFTSNGAHLRDHED
ncbi:MAG: alpha/beta fold hydrolase [Candidatus Lambdaproteobacteria bacterium]|nr:alpha/beta fold hydrolase [Candidatus Lambdaproteobacteria bacterium]